MSFVPLLQAANTQSTSGSMLSMLVTFGLIFVVMYFFILRPQNKKQKETEKMINSLKKGDKVVTIGGIHGVVSSTKEKTIILKVDDNTKIEFNRTAISSVVVDKPVDSKKDEKKDEKKKDKSEKDFIADAPAEQPTESK